MVKKVTIQIGQKGHKNWSFKADLRNVKKTLIKRAPKKVLQKIFLHFIP